jgi:hypothetical protein
VGRTAGVSEQQLMALPDFERSPAFNDVEKLVLRYATAMTNTPVEVSDAMFEALRQHLDERQLVELTSAIAWENYRARFDHALESTPKASTAAHCVCFHNQKPETTNEKRSSSSYRSSATPSSYRIAARPAPVHRRKHDRDARHTFCTPLPRGAFRKLNPSRSQRFPVQSAL